MSLQRTFVTWGLLRAALRDRGAAHPNLVDIHPPVGTVVSMTKLPTILTIAALAALPFTAGTAHADEPATCTEGQVASGPYCVNPIYVNNPLFVDPATCEWGYFQGNCVPDTLRSPADHLPADYTFQTPDPAIASAPTAARPAEPIVAPVVAVWLTTAELESFDLRHGPR